MFCLSEVKFTSYILVIYSFIRKYVFSVIGRIKKSPNTDRFSYDQKGRPKISWPGPFKAREGSAVPRRERSATAAAAAAS
jgi:hypothetical protein